MKNKYIAFLLTGLLALSGCTANTNGNSGPDIPPEPEHSEPAEIQPVPGEQPQVEDVTSIEEETENPLEGLVQNQYEGLTISAAVLPRMAILPGSAIPVNVVVENTGDQTVNYVLGSSSYDTPDALLIQSGGLQPVPFRDRVGGAMTMDYVVRELAPGESLEFQVYVMAVEPMEDFNDYAYKLYEAEQLYIADAESSHLQELYTEIVPVQPGSYTVQVSFAYGLAEEDDIFNGPCADSQAELQASVTD